MRFDTELETQEHNLPKCILLERVHKAAAGGALPIAETYFIHQLVYHFAQISNRLRRHTLQDNLIAGKEALFARA